jgi:small subunit ribosomal protein S13
LSRGRIVYRVK